MSSVDHIEDLLRWLEPLGNALVWVGVDHLPAAQRRWVKSEAPMEFRSGDFAYVYGEFPKRRRSYGLAANEFWFRGKVMDGERVVLLFKLLS